VQNQVTFNRVPEKVPEKVWQAENVGEALVQSQVRFLVRFFSQQGSVEGPEKVWEALVQSQVRFNRVPEKVPGEEGLQGFGAEPAQAQQSSGEGSREGSGRLWCRARSGSTGFPEKKVWEALVQSQRRLNRVPEKVPEKVLGGLRAEPWVKFRRMFLEKVWEALVQSQVRFTRFPEKVPEKLPGGFGGSGSTRFWRRFRRRSGRLWCRARSGSTVSSAWLRSTLQEMCENKTLRLLGIPPKLILILASRHMEYGCNTRTMTLERLLAGYRTRYRTRYRNYILPPSQDTPRSDQTQ